MHSVFRSSYRIKTVSMAFWSFSRISDLTVLLSSEVFEISAVRLEKESSFPRRVRNALDREVKLSGELHNCL